MTKQTPEVPAPRRRRLSWSDPGTRSLLYQALVIGIVGFVAWYLVSNTLYNLSASRDIGRDVSLLIRLDNVTDKEYTVANTYATMGRAVYVGLTWAPR